MARKALCGHSTISFITRNSRESCFSRAVLQGIPNSLYLHTCTCTQSYEQLISLLTLFITIMCCHGN